MPIAIIKAPSGDETTLHDMGGFFMLGGNTIRYQPHNRNLTLARIRAKAGETGCRFTLL